MNIIKKELDVVELKKQLQEGERLEFLFKRNGTPHPNGNEHYYCNNGH